MPRGDKKYVVLLITPCIRTRVPYMYHHYMDYLDTLKGGVVAMWDYEPEHACRSAVVL